MGDLNVEIVLCYHSYPFALKCYIVIKLNRYILNYHLSVYKNNHINILAFYSKNRFILCLYCM